MTLYKALLQGPLTYIFIMLDENLPTFRFKQSSENPLSSIVYFTQNGSDPAPEYVFKRADPANPAARNKYAVALTDPYAPDVIYGDVVVAPEWQQPTLSAAEIRAQQQQNGGQPMAPAPLIPDSFTIQLYNPDQTVSVKMHPGSFTKTDSWEFEMLSQSFKVPSNSQIDRQNQNGSPVGDGEPAPDFRPRIMFRWKKDGRLSKDMTCFNVGRSLGKHKSKEPDITVGLYKQARESEVTIYEPNLQRVDIEDRKGLDIVLVIGAEVIRELYLAPRHDLFNLGGAPPVASGRERRKNSKPTSPPPAAPSMAMSGALGATPPAPATATTAANVGPSSGRRPSDAEIEAETRRLKAMVEQEERERNARMQRERRDRERREREEEKRIKRMLDEEDREQRRRQADIERETERLKKLYGMEGQDLPSSRPAGGSHTSPALPPRPQFQPQPPQPPRPQHNWFAAPSTYAASPPPPRPLSAGPGTGPFDNNNANPYSWWRAGAHAGPSQAPPGPVPGPSHQQPPPKPGRKPNAPGPYLSGANPAAQMSQFFQKIRDDGKKVTKKRSMGW